MWDTFSSVRGVLGALDLPCSELGKPLYGDAEIAPSDCYDLASLLVSELAYLHSTVPGAAPPSAADLYEVGNRLPAHCFQYAGQLAGYVDALHAAAKGDAGAFRG